MTDLTLIQNEVDTQLANKEVAATLVKTTFKGLSEPNMKQAIMEGMMRGFNFKDFLEKNIYAVPFGGGYSLVTSIDLARKVGQKSGVVGKTKPTYTYDDQGNLQSCEITVKKKTGDYIGDYTEEVFYKEYSTGKNLWQTKPLTMLAKVAEMHALRQACPEEMSQLYVEEEFQKEEKQKPLIDVQGFKEKMAAAKSLNELKTVWANMPIEAKKELESLKYDLKAKFEDVPAIQ